MAQQASLEAVEVVSSVAFDALVARRLDAAYRLAALLLLDPNEAQDATHDAFLKAARSWSTLRDPASADAWFDRIVVNECRDRLRHRHRHPVTDISDEVSQGLTIADGADASIERDRIRQALGRLSADLRIVVVLRYYEGLPVDETARRIGVPSGTVKSRLHHALRELQAALAADDREGFR